MPTSLLIAAGTAGINYGASKLFGGQQKDPLAGLRDFQPTTFSGGGLTSTFGGGQAGISASPERTAAVGGLANTFGAQANEIGAMQPLVAPGFSAFRNAQLGQIENSRTASISNLRENLGRRRVLGSSFGQDAISRSEAEFAKQKADVEASSFLQEMAATQNLIQQKYTAARGAFQTGLDEMNLEANLAAGLAGKATDVLSKAADTEARLMALQNQGAGQFFGQTFAPVGKAIGTAAGNFFGGGGSGALSYTNAGTGGSMYPMFGP